MSRRDVAAKRAERDAKLRQAQQECKDVLVQNCVATWHEKLDKKTATDEIKARKEVQEEYTNAAIELKRSRSLRLQELFAAENKMYMDELASMGYCIKRK